MSTNEKDMKQQEGESSKKDSFIAKIKDKIDKEKHNRQENPGIVAEKQWKAWIYLSPIIILMLIFTVYPFFSTIVYSFLNGYNRLDALNNHTAFSFGIANYTNAFKNPNVRNSFITTIYVVFITVPISTLLALLISVALNSIKFLQKILQTVFFLPYVTNAIAIGMVFSVMFTTVGAGDSITTYGVISDVLKMLGMKPIIWMGTNSTYATNMFVLCFYIIWSSLPFKILILLGALQSINNQYYDAAKIDSTPKWRVLLRITVPLLSPMISYILITGFIGAFKTYTALIGLFGENPANDRMKTIVSIIMESITEQNIGTASAAAVMLLIIIFIITRINLWVSKRSVHY